MSGCWTGERVDLLTRLWAEGRSTSEIAAEMGAGLTRNAVIGKVHRLGLPSPALPKSSRPKSKPQAPAVEPAPEPAPPSAAAIAISPAPEPDPEPVAPTAGPEPVAIPVSARVTIVELRDSMCRWPLGDPRSDDFRYCGSRATEVVSGALVYCAACASLAFQPSQERRRFAARPSAPAQHHPTSITAAA